MSITTDEKIFISWAPYSRRSQSLSAELGIHSHLIHYLKFQRPVYAPFKYVLQALHTLVLLLKERPRIVFVQDPPIFASLVVYVYTSLTFGQARFIVDAHTGALLHPCWKSFQRLQKFVYCRALTVITTNRTLTELVRSWGADSITLAGPPINIPPGEAMQLSKAFNLVLINTFSPDEPLSVVLEAVADMPDVHLYITGDVNKAFRSLLERAPDNVTFTGFLPDDDYLKLLRGADAIMVLTERDFTLQLGGMEAVALGKPILTSDQSFLREYFDRGTVHVPNTPDGVRQGIIQLQKDLGRLSEEILDLRRAHQKEWSTKSQQLREFMTMGATK
ncbi:MAG TPA: glycosyltransferase [Armatimonadetes bacterium]|nr:glycosyltransferase [Armatimonadota bacterium]